MASAGFWSGLGSELGAERAKARGEYRAKKHSAKKHHSRLYTATNNTSLANMKLQTPKPAAPRSRALQSKSKPKPKKPTLKKRKSALLQPLLTAGLQQLLFGWDFSSPAPVSVADRLRPLWPSVKGIYISLPIHRYFEVSLRIEILHHGEGDLCLGTVVDRLYAFYNTANNETNNLIRYTAANQCRKPLEYNYQEALDAMDAGRTVTYRQLLGSLTCEGITLRGRIADGPYYHAAVEFGS